MQAMSGKHSENDRVLKQQLTNLIDTFQFLYGSFDLEKAVRAHVIASSSQPCARLMPRQLCGYDRQRFGARLTAIFESLFPYFRPAKRNMSSIFNALKYQPFNKVTTAP